jgi:hypothetical protein
VDAASQEQGSGSATGMSRRDALVTSGVALAGVLFTSILAGGVLAGGALRPSMPTGTSEIAMVAPAELNAALTTLNPISAGALAAEARACRAPLAMMTLTKAPGTQGGTIRIRSGAYLSPPFQVADVPQRIAVPFPTPYPTGHGQMMVEGWATGVGVSLTPTWWAPNLRGAGVINVIWNTNKPCGA